MVCLQSETAEKFRLGIESAEALIRNQTLIDLEVQANELLQLLLRV